MLNIVLRAQDLWYLLPTGIYLVFIYFLHAAGQTAPLGALTGICNSLQPANSEKFISSNLPRRNRLLHFVAVCCHQEQDYRPRAADSIQDLLSL